MKFRTAYRKNLRMTHRHPKAADGVDVFFLWSCTHYDGPMSGICLYKGQKCAFKAVVGSFEKRRIFAIVALTDEQFAHEEWRQKIFAEMIGPHTYYRYEEGRRRRHPPNQPHVDIPREIVMKCYALRGKETDLSESNVLAWMEI